MGSVCGCAREGVRWAWSSRPGPNSGVVNTCIYEREVSGGARVELSLHSHTFEGPERQEVTLLERGPLPISHKPEWL